MKENPAQLTTQRADSPASREASPQEIGDALTAQLKQRDRDNPPEPGFVERMMSRPEGLLLLLLILAVGAGVLSSSPVQELLRRLVTAP